MMTMMHTGDIPRQVMQFSYSKGSPGIEMLPRFDYFPTKFPDDYVDDEPMNYPIEDFLVDFEGSDQVDDGQWSPLSSSSSLRSDEPSVITQVSHGSSTLCLPTDDMDIESHLSLHHLMKAYSEAVENGQADLTEALSRCLAEKADPLGLARDRLVFNLFPHAGRQGRGHDDYIMQESRVNTNIASQVFYQGFPFGRFAHFAANRAIMGSAPRGFGVTIRVVDFDLGEGVQWAPVIEAVAARRDKSILRLTSIKWDDEEIGDDNQECPESSRFGFQDMSRRLYEHAREFGVELKVEEMTIDELLREVKEGMAMYGRREWIAFNCMVGLLGRKRKSWSQKQLGKFLAAAQEIIMANNCGILTLGEGDAFGKLKSSTRFSEFFDGCLSHYQAILECMEAEFPSHLLEARLAMEALFVLPSIDPATWSEAWDELRACEGVTDMIKASLGGLRVSMEGLMEVRDLVRGNNNKTSSYGVGIGEMENEMILEWRGNPLIRFSSWGR